MSSYFFNEVISYLSVLFIVGKDPWQEANSVVCNPDDIQLLSQSLTTVAKPLSAGLITISLFNIFP